MVVCSCQGLRRYGLLRQLLLRRLKASIFGVLPPVIDLHGWRKCKRIVWNNPCPAVVPSRGVCTSVCIVFKTPLKRWLKVRSLRRAHVFYHLALQFYDNDGLTCARRTLHSICYQPKTKSSGLHRLAVLFSKFPRPLIQLITCKHRLRVFWKEYRPPVWTAALIHHNWSN